MWPRTRRSARLYVGRNIVARLTRLSGAMIEIASGARQISVPVAGSDEVAAMGRAVEVFRRNAIELDELLAERAETAARLEKTVEERTAELVGREATLRVIFDNIPQGVALFGRDLKMVAWNEQFREIVGLADDFLAQEQRSFLILSRPRRGRVEGPTAPIQRFLISSQPLSPPRNSGPESPAKRRTRRFFSKSRRYYASRLS
jgi:PAS domain-containing protein